MSLRRQILGVFVLAWFMTALNPCLMAMGAEDDCSHCPPVNTCAAPASDSHPESHCALDDQLEVKLQGIQVNHQADKHFSHPKKPPYIDLVADNTPAKAFVSRPLPDRLLAFNHPSDPPLHIQYCVYLI